MTRVDSLLTLFSLFLNLEQFGITLWRVFRQHQDSCMKVFTGFQSAPDGTTVMVGDEELLSINEALFFDSPEKIPPVRYIVLSSRALF